MIPFLALKSETVPPVAAHAPRHGVAAATKGGPATRPPPVHVGTGVPKEASRPPFGEVVLEAMVRPSGPLGPPPPLVAAVGETYGDTVPDGALAGVAHVEVVPLPPVDAAPRRPRPVPGVDTEGQAPEAPAAVGVVVGVRSHGPAVAVVAPPPVALAVVVEVRLVLPRPLGPETAPGLLARPRPDTALVPGAAATPAGPTDGVLAVGQERPDAGGLDGGLVGVGPVGPVVTPATPTPPRRLDAVVRVAHLLRPAAAVAPAATPRDGPRVLGGRPATPATQVAARPVPAIRPAAPQDAVPAPVRRVAVAAPPATPPTGVLAEVPGAVGQDRRTPRPPPLRVAGPRAAYNTRTSPATRAAPPSVDAIPGTPPTRETADEDRPPRPAAFPVPAPSGVPPLAPAVALRPRLFRRAPSYSFPLPGTSSFKDKAGGRGYIRGRSCATQTGTGTCCGTGNSSRYSTCRAAACRGRRGRCSR